MESSTHIYLPKITCGNIAVKIIAFESLAFWWKQPMLFVPDENHVIIQLLFIVLSVVTPFVSGMIERDFVPPPPYSLQTCAIAELSSSILTNEPQASGRASVWPLKYWTTASPVLLAAVVKWNVRPCCLLQKNRSWVKDTLDLSSFIVLLRRTMFPLL